MAKRLAGAGSRLALVDLDESALQATAEECRAAGSPQAQGYVANVAKEAEVEALFDTIAADFGAIHGLVNNAGIIRDALMLKYKDGNEAAAKMIESGEKGCIVNISSISRSGNMGQANYSAAKAGVQAMSVVWAKEFARFGIRSASIAPGFVSTELVMSMKPEAREKMTRPIPAGRLGEPDEIAHTVQFILENEYVNGRCIEVDGALRL
jgi:3-oxoacyl-[acyl-carrier protein] reductase